VGKKPDDQEPIPKPVRVAIAQSPPLPDKRASSQRPGFLSSGRPTRCPARLRSGETGWRATCVLDCIPRGTGETLPKDVLQAQT